MNPWDRDHTFGRDEKKPGEMRTLVVVLLPRPFLTDYVERRTDVKPSTTRHLNEARRYLLEFFGEDRTLTTGTEFVITHSRNRKFNPRTQMIRIIEQAGLKPWPKVFQNLRATRETELAQEFPLQVVCAWRDITESCG